jgi:phosphate:Na+ symporter
LDVFYAVLALVTGVGIFMVGIVMFSEGLEKNVSRGVRALLRRISGKRFAGVGIGAGVTAIVQSSSATTVMVIGLVNAGILTLFQATAIIMGANIGTTVTGLLVSLSTFQIKYVFMSLAFIGAFMKLVTKKERWTRLADLMISFGVLFVGLELMGAALSGNDELKGAFMRLFEAVRNPLLLIFLGAAFTAIIQSSSASTAIFISMIGQRLLSFDSAVYLVLGANIGTCITAFLASLTANTNAKRAALIHVLFNTIGAVIFTAFLWPLHKYITPFYERLIPSPQWQLAVFHVIFNVSTTLILVWFITPLNKIAYRIIKDKPEKEEAIHVSYIDERLLKTPTIAIENTKKEIVAMAEKTRDNLHTAFNAFLTQDLSVREKVLKEEEGINFLNRTLARYLVKISATSISFTNEKLIGGFHHVINDIERIGDHAANMAYYADGMRERGSTFSEAAANDLSTMFAKESELFDLSLKVFSERDPSMLKKVSALEGEIDRMKRELADSHIRRLNAGECTFESGEFYYAVITDMERIADHLTNIAFTIRSFTGSEHEAYQKIESESEKRKARI